MRRDPRLYLDDILDAIGNIREYTMGQNIVGLRNILAHEYFSASIPVVWDVEQNKLGQLEYACKELLEVDMP